MRTVLTLCVLCVLAEQSFADDKKDKQPDGTTSMCIDQEIADRLALKRRRRGAVDRLFIKQARHELSITGGYYNSDLLSGT